MTCVACGDTARAARIIAVTDAGMARVELDGITEDVMLDLVDAMVGDVVLVHAGVAIGTLR